MPADDEHLKKLSLNRWQHRGKDSGEEVEEKETNTPGEPATMDPENHTVEETQVKEPPEETHDTGRTLRLDTEGQHMHAWRKAKRDVSECVLCELHRTRKNTVFGVGSEEADLMLIGEAPGADEDEQGEPFVGRAGRLLDSMLMAIGLSREQVFIANILKCRPPNNENPTPEQAERCRPHLELQIEMIQPKVILAVGAVAAQNLLDVETPISKLRGTTHEMPGTGLPLIPTYHPAYLLRRPQGKAEAFKDLLLLCEVLKEHGVAFGSTTE